MKAPLGILPLMFLIMFALKLAGVITFSWWIVTVPLWGLFALGAAILLTPIALAGAALVTLWVLKQLGSRRR